MEVLRQPTELLAAAELHRGVQHDVQAQQVADREPAAQERARDEGEAVALRILHVPREGREQDRHRESQPDHESGLRNATVQTRSKPTESRNGGRPD